ncbi:hypothetical protein E2C01_037206 [Portunus trituberculatus]|uniref:Uncharacterized protein n=1 Tax=Portunus trituberculatus TaxID=210409 RepID=A0A5B7FE13_PORTR|nr:hypothetical protein [Portunus trituberculatus]
MMAMCLPCSSLWRPLLQAPGNLRRRFPGARLILRYNEHRRKQKNPFRVLPTCGVVHRIALSSRNRLHEGCCSVCRTFSNMKKERLDRSWLFDERERAVLSMDWEGCWK